MFRRSCIRRAAQYDIGKINEKLHLLYGLQNVLLDIDLAIKNIRETEQDKEVVPNLMKSFAIDEIQANFVADIRLRNINKEYILNRVQEISNLEAELKRLQEILDNDKKVDKIIIKELQQISKKYSIERKTRLVSPDNLVQHESTTEIEDYNLKVFFTAHNYLKKVTLISLRSSGDHKIKEEDEILQEIDGTNKDEIIFFTNQCNAYKMKLYEIEDHKVSSLGVYLPNILGLEPGEEVLYCVVTSDFKGFMIFGFENGKVARVPLEAYKTKTNRKKLIKAFSDESKLIRMHHFEEDGDLTAIRESSKEIRAVVFNTSLVTEKVTKNTRGIQVIRMRKGSTMAALFKTEQHPFEELDKYRITDIPKSGEELDPLEKLTLNKWIKL